MYLVKQWSKTLLLPLPAIPVTETISRSKEASTVALGQLLMDTDYCECKHFHTPDMVPLYQTEDGMIISNFFTTPLILNCAAFGAFCPIIGHYCISPVVAPLKRLGLCDIFRTLIRFLQETSRVAACICTSLHFSSPCSFSFSHIYCSTFFACQSYSWINWFWLNLLKRASW